MSDANRVRTLYGLEAEYGTFAGRDLFVLRMTGESLQSTPTYVASAELRSDRQRADQILQDFRASGGLNLELSYAAFDVPMALLLQAPLVTIEASGNTVSASTTDDSFNTTGTWDLQPVAGTVIYVSGFSDPANNGWHRVVSSTTSKIVVASNLVTEAAPATSEIVAIWPSNEKTVSGVALDFVVKGGNDWPKITRGSGSFVTAGLTAGNWIRVKSAAESGNNAYMKLISVSALELEVMPATAGGDLVADTADSAAVLVQGTMIENGTEFNTVSIVREHGDLVEEAAADAYDRFLGMGFNTFTLNVATTGILTGSFGFEGKSEAQASALGGTAVAAPTNKVLNSVRHVKAVFEGFTKFGVTAINLNVSNNLEGRREVGSFGPVSVRSGTIDVTGSLQMYYSTAAKAIKAKALADIASSSAVIVDDDSGTTYGNAYVFDYPRFKYSSYTTPAGGINQDVFLNTDWAGYAHESENKTMRIVKFAAD